MLKINKGIFLLFLISCLLEIQSYGQMRLTAEDSDPKKMGWMQGFPPSNDKIVSAIDGSFFQFPALRYSVCHMRQFMPTTSVKMAALAINGVT